jgi:membrane protein DedA with SNARE-associated domain
VIAQRPGSVAGALAPYAVGRWAGEPAIRATIRRHSRLLRVAQADLARALAAIRRHGDLAVFAGRVVPLARSVISIPVGMDLMPLGRFVALTTLGSAVWCAALAGAGRMLGEHWELALAAIERRQVLVVIALAGAAVLGLARLALIRRARGHLAAAGADDG